MPNRRSKDVSMSTTHVRGRVPGKSGWRRNGDSKKRQKQNNTEISVFGNGKSLDVVFLARRCWTRSVLCCRTIGTNSSQNNFSCMG